MPGWRLRTSLAASMPSFWKVGGMRMSVTTTCGRRPSAPGDQLVVVLGHADDLEVGLEAEQRPHALADEQVVVGEEHGDAPDGHGSIRPQSGGPGKGASPAPARGLAPLGHNRSGRVPQARSSRGVHL